MLIINVFEMVIWLLPMVATRAFVAQNGQSKSNFHQLEKTSRRTVVECSSSQANNMQQSSNLILAIFPTRKSVRVPTNRLTLNLYEPRYLALTDYAMANGSIFGAAYCSSKSQLVRYQDKLGPIATPMMQVGDVGVVCHILESTEGKRYGSNERKVSLEALAVERFQIKKILSNGYDMQKGYQTQQQLPYILVEASLLKDEHDEHDDNQATQFFDTDLLDPTEKSSIKRAMSLLDNDESRRLELLSFALLSKFSNQLTAEEMEQFLLDTDPVRRLKQINSCVKSQKSWINAPKQQICEALKRVIG